ncbi:MAG: tripartite tricarboxylate transporter substrate binding protein [Burkholderiales bacterium]|nr:tripartite tricarboxylate transporter substrate binding protein [Burkholderiales bacterium]
MKLTGRFIALGIAAMSALGAHAAEQAFPTRPIRVLIAYPPGASTDSNARIVAARMTETLGQQVLVDNRPGANGAIATLALAKSPPDGHTLMMVDIAHGANPAVYDKLPYDTLKDFAGIGMVARVPMVLLVHPSLPVKTPKDLIGLAKSKPGQLNYASAGVGSAMFLVGELFKDAAMIDVVMVAYKGGGPALSELIGGHVPMLFISLVAAMPHVSAGRVRALGVSSLKRMAAAPDMPTIAETGVPGFEFYLWQGMIGPVAIAGPIVTRLNREINAALDDPQVKDRLIKAGNELIGGTPAQATEFIRSEVERWRKVIKPEMRIKN